MLDVSPLAMAALARAEFDALLMNERYGPMLRQLSLYRGLTLSGVISRA